MKKDELGNRMKRNYEDITRYYLPRRTHTIIRLDGKAFHTLTRGMQKPFDYDFIDAMNYTSFMLCENIQGAVLAFTQSDEISILLQDYKEITTDAWFGGNVQKIASISASMATAYFNYYYKDSQKLNRLAMFDSRVFTIPEVIEVENYFLWRQLDATRNSISMMAQSLYSHKELNNKNQSDMLSMIKNKDRDWEELPYFVKRGKITVKTEEGWETPITPDILKERVMFSELLKLERND